MALLLESRCCVLAGKAISSDDLKSEPERNEPGRRLKYPEFRVRMALFAVLRGAVLSYENRATSSSPRNWPA